MPPARPRVAIVHDYLTQRGGAERVVLSMAKAFPGAPIHTTLYAPEQTYPEFADLDVRVSPLNRVGSFRRHHRLALPFLVPATEAMRVEADVVLCSSSGWAHGVRTHGAKVVYCHTPARWLYLTDEYLGSALWRSPRGLVSAPLFGALRWWDRRKAFEAHTYLANSTLIRDRIHRVYGIDAEVVHPPAGLHAEHDHDMRPPISGWEPGSFDLCVSRLLPYKNVEAVVETYRGRTDRLVLVGGGPLLERLLASLPPNVRLLHGIADAELSWLYASCRALVAASFEDFGLTPVEAMSFGRPVVALRAGGYLDSVVEPEVGVFFDEPTPAAIGAALDRLACTAFSASTITAHAERFSEDVFVERLRQVVLAEAAALHDVRS